MHTKFIVINTVIVTLFLSINGSANSNSHKSASCAELTNTHFDKKAECILVLGDSNGALEYGWVKQMEKLRPNDSILNFSISGNTIGFNNLGRSSLNTLSNVDSIMKEVYSKYSHIDKVVMMLGTNDCKTIFKDSLKYAAQNMRSLLRHVKSNANLHNDKTLIFVVSPPPFGSDTILGEKYTGGLERVSWLNAQLKIIAGDEGAVYIDSFSILLPVFNYLSTDGVHLNSDGQLMIAHIIEENLKFFPASGK